MAISTTVLRPIFELAAPLVPTEPHDSAECNCPTAFAGDTRYSPMTTGGISADLRTTCSSETNPRPIHLHASTWTRSSYLHTTLAVRPSPGGERFRDADLEFAIRSFVPTGDRSPHNRLSWNETATTLAGLPNYHLAFEGQMGGAWRRLRLSLLGRSLRHHRSCIRRYPTPKSTVGPNHGIR